MAPAMPFCVPRNLEASPRDAFIVNGTTAMAHSLGLETVAEGVETAAQRDALLGFGCITMQGFFFGKPGTAEEFATRLRARTEFARHGRTSSGALAG